MKPCELAQRIPRLFHVTRPGAGVSIKLRGMRCAQSLIAESVLSATEQVATADMPRAAEVPLTLRDGSFVALNDNLPLNLSKLAPYLDGEWTPVDWLRWLNQHVFFWPSEQRLASLLNARANRGRERDVLVFDMMSLLSSHSDRVALSPINSGSTIHLPARRGPATFTSMGALSFDDWQRLRGMSKRDQVAEVVVRGDLLDAGQHLMEIRRYRGVQRLN